MQFYATDNPEGLHGMKRFVIALLMIGSASGVITGCESWPSKYQGVTLDEVDERAKQARSGLRTGSTKPNACSRVSFAHARGILSPQSTITETWESCITQLRKMEQEAQARRARERRRNKREHQQYLQRRQERREEHGPDFLNLYNMAKYRGADKANEMLAEYDGKYSIAPEIMVTGCNDRICTADFPDVAEGMTGSGQSLNLLVKGISVEPGRSLSDFELVRFETYGHGLRKSAVAVFTKRN